jgi:hypothetical protein
MTVSFGSSADLKTRGLGLLRTGVAVESLLPTPKFLNLVANDHQPHGPILPIRFFKRAIIAIRVAQRAKLRAEYSFVDVND